MLSDIRSEFLQAEMNMHFRAATLFWAQGEKARGPPKTLLLKLAISTRNEGTLDSEWSLSLESLLWLSKVLISFRIQVVFRTI